MVQAQPDLQVLQDQQVVMVLTVRKEQQELLVVQALQVKKEPQEQQDQQVVMVLTGLKVKKVK